jgi:hypothetical protein
MGVTLRRIFLSSLLAVLLLALALSGPAAAAPPSPSFVLQTLTSTSSGAFAGLNGISCKSVTACVAVGTTKSSGQTVGLAAVLDGNTWTLSDIIQSGVTTPALNGVWCASDTSCVAVGSHTQSLLGAEPLIETLSGTKWTAVTTGLEPAGGIHGVLSSVSCVSSTSCVAVGTYVFAGNNHVLVDTLSGTRWTASEAALPGGASGAAGGGIQCFTATSCLAVGASSAGGAISSLVETLSGTTWTAATLHAGDTLTSLSCPSAGSCTAVGDTGGGQSVAEVLASATWTRSVIPLPTGTTSIQLNGVSCTTDGSGECLAVGGYLGTSPDNKQDHALVEFRSSGTWQATTGLDPASPAGHVLLNGVSCPIDISSCTGAGDNTVGSVQAAEALYAFPPSCNGGQACVAAGTGYQLVASDGGIFNYGSAGFFGSTGGLHLNAPVVGMAPTPDGAGYWLVASDGGIFNYGDAGFAGSAGALHLNAPIVAMAATPDGGGYWLVASDGGIFTYGDAVFHGSAGALHLNAPIVGMAATPDGGGYWLVASDGGIFTYGDAMFQGSTGGLRLNAPVVGMATTPDGGGYWLVASDGGIFNYGDAGFDGSAGALHLNAPVVGMDASTDGGGYWLVATDGGIFNYGDAGFFGSAGSLRLNAPIVGMS